MVTPRAGTTNPLVPKYKLASFVESPTNAPKFIRDSMNVADIAGTRSGKSLASYGFSPGPGCMSSDLYTRYIDRSGKNGDSQRMAEINGATSQKAKVSKGRKKCE